MPTKAQKAQKQRYNEEVRSAKERMANLNEQQVNTMINYVSYQILYMNDAACNECKFLESKIKTIPYRGNGAQKLYGALMKRVHAYWDFVNTVVKIDQNSLAELMGEIDGYMDDTIKELRSAIKAVLEKNNIEQAEWVADVEAARTVVSYAVQITDDYIDSLSKLTSQAKLLNALSITEIKRVMENFATFVQTAAHMDGIFIDLNKDERTIRAFKRFNKAFVKPENFITAANNADIVNEQENREKLM